MKMTHEALEYKVAFQVLKDLRPKMYNFLEDQLRFLEHEKVPDRIIKFENVIEEYLMTHRLEMGEYLYGLYTHLYRALKQTKVI